MFLTMSSHQSLLEEIDREQRFKHVLEQSLKDLEHTVCQLEERSGNPDVSEWQLRYTTQVELNHHLDQQKEWLRGQVECQQGRPFIGSAELDLDSFSEAQLARCLRQLEKDRDNLRSDVRDLEWRLDQESKAFHKFDETRKAYQTEIRDAMTNLEALRSRVKMISNDYVMFSKRKGNILPNQRVLDPKRGPIRKIAAVRSLPKLNSGHHDRTSGHMSE
ncbi:coiled-coil domain-containing protein 169 [Galendromus occidentalis]|uniref:Coiled-coil domain-containing protein 169 n=1 Tax=Galendromus occidentalis TaxID=34638 RepID=A0AAJ7L4X9_9ACAR|nr:coiled-coil domain-containing protein 169 [Galendromus occidentalis]